MDLLYLKDKLVGYTQKTRVDSYFMTCDPPTYERDLYVTKERHFPF